MLVSCSLMLDLMYKAEVDLSLEFGFLYIKCRSISHYRTLLYGQFVQSITVLLDSSIHILDTRMPVYVRRQKEDTTTGCTTAIPD